VNSRTYTPLYAAYDPDAGAGFLVSQTTAVSQSEERWAKYQSDYLLNYNWVVIIFRLLPGGPPTPVLIEVPVEEWLSVVGSLQYLITNAFGI